MTRVDEIILEALTFERDHWAWKLECKRMGRKGSSLEVWATERVATLTEIINRMELAE